MQIRGCSKEWAAAEVISKWNNGELMSIEVAKAADVYSFGKLCAWILLKSSLATAEQFERENISEYRYMRPGVSVDDDHLVFSPLRRAMPFLKPLFEQSFCIDAARRAPISDLIQLLSKSRQSCVRE